MTGFDIYRIEGCNYIGSTLDLNDRRANHIRHCFNPNHKSYNIKLYKFIRDNNIEIKLISIFRRNENFSYRCMLFVEQLYIEKYNSINNGLNMRNAYTNQKKYGKEYRLKNNREEYFKKFYSNPINLEKKRLQAKLHMRGIRSIKKNRDEMNRKNRIIIICDICGNPNSKSSISRHKKRNICSETARKNADVESFRKQLRNWRFKTKGNVCYYNLEI
jgi:hypothetical protein